MRKHTNVKSADQAAYPHGLISAFDIHCLESSFYVCIDVLRHREEFFQSCHDDFYLRSYGRLAVELNMPPS